MSPNCLLTDHRDPRCPTILHRILSRGVGMTRISEMPWMAQIQIESQTQVQIQPKFKFKTQIQIRTRSQTQVQIQNLWSDWVRGPTRGFSAFMLQVNTRVVPKSVFRRMGFSRYRPQWWGYIQAWQQNTKYKIILGNMPYWRRYRRADI